MNGLQDAGLATTIVTEDIVEPGNGFDADFTEITKPLDLELFNGHWLTRRILVRYSRIGIMTYVQLWSSWG